jgi:hypothetical protein
MEWPNSNGCMVLFSELTNVSAFRLASLFHGIQYPMNWKYVQSPLSPQFRYGITPLYSQSRGGTF